MSSSPPPTTPLPARLRRERVLAYVDQREFARVTEMAEQFEVSTVTLRTDLEHLSRRGLLRRVRGGAVSRSAGRPEPAFEEAQTANVAQKKAIGRHTAGMIGSGETVILDVGTTTTAVAHAMADRDDLRDVMVFTNSLTIAMALESSAPRITVVVTGGTLRPRQHSLVDPLAALVLDQITAKWAIIGCNGIDIDGGVTNANLPETDVKRRMIGAATRRVVCADSSKLGGVALARICGVGDIDVLVTDGRADQAVVTELEGSGVDVHVAN
ncbi:DeoR/GlpR family DNA-binding transcription regulator [Euzebya tangerina]|uniref:DeoR/GlpR family DNA-binding transcription regulator n=1 Tax=Euzebya tangerina TaxID=591198 RepID=UPI000E31E219|nr:DeoR/GlpR family DNA-binding transcription regulator [Euzebya tangerina]